MIMLRMLFVARPSTLNAAQENRLIRFAQSFQSILLQDVRGNMYSDKTVGLHLGFGESSAARCFDETHACKPTKEEPKP
jgi:hypothetical protein